MTCLPRCLVRLFALCLAGIAAAAPAQPQSSDWPSRPITYVAPYPAGSPVDLIARRIGQGLQRRLGQPVVVDNRVGAGGTVGTAFVAKASADGYTIVAGSISTHAINASLYPRLAYDPVKDFAPVTYVGSTALVLVVNPAVLPVASVQEFVAYAKAHPGQVQYGSAGNGSSLHLAGELFKSQAKADLSHIPYKGSTGAMNDLLGGQIGAMFENLPNALPHIQSGRLRALAVTSPRRAAALPAVPTVAETVAPGYEMLTWHAVLAPAGTPQAVVTKLDAAIRAVLSQPEEQAFFAARSIDITPGGPEQLRALIAREIPKWRAIVRESGATVD
ncbi:Bug family tripartite tricarboxylate transporter substrate binding protein [Xylophilus sp.]|uniref:Bug family tripartite tricarboxylate transporter substrate binding protein n=1 Tax=Xylophilus sp. TaxID=2653893 RepID=UPI0013B8BEDB|nr:tripartite tricarboxylate transporter substrate binding protein [Xylophilus sp.]KAF1047517.1 MAG: hypothetical protein GAK38_01868 [Xylophilus sp.]